MKRKLIATFLLLIVLPTALLFVYVVTQSQHMAVDNAQRSTLRTMEQTAREVENLVYMVEYASDVLYQDPVLRAFVGDREEGDLRTMLRQVDSLRSAMSSSESALGLHRIRLYLHDEKMSAREHAHFFSLRDAAQQEWYEDVVLDSGLGSRSGVYYDRSMVDAAPQWLHFLPAHCPRHQCPGCPRRHPLHGFGRKQPVCPHSYRTHQNHGGHPPAGRQRQCAIFRG